MSSKGSKEDVYWERYYQNFVSIPQRPSQFAAFSLGEFVERRVNQVIDYGCGNGRDGLFFHSHGMKTICVDNSLNAINKLKEFQCENFTPVNQSVLTPLDERAANTIDKSLPLAVYARFFLHALTNSEIKIFLENCASLTKASDIFLFEYRNRNDVDGTKETKAHYRNFLDPLFVARTASALDFELVYEVSGKGFAKFGNDDAVVTRQIFRRVS